MSAASTYRGVDGVGARGIFDGVERGEETCFPMWSRSRSPRAGAVASPSHSSGKNAAFAPASVASL